MIDAPFHPTTLCAVVSLPLLLYTPNTYTYPKHVATLFALGSCLLEQLK